MLILMVAIATCEIGVGYLRVYDCTVRSFGVLDRANSGSRVLCDFQGPVEPRVGELFTVGLGLCGGLWV